MRPIVSPMHRAWKCVTPPYRPPKLPAPIKPRRPLPNQKDLPIMLQTVPPPSRGPQTSPATLAERPPAETANEEEVFEPQRVITARMNKSRHIACRRLAGHCGISMNQLVVAAIDHVLNVGLAYRDEDDADVAGVFFPSTDLDTVYSEEQHGKALELTYRRGSSEATRDRSGETDAAAPYQGTAAAVA